MTNEWLTPAPQWGLRTWVALALLSLLPIGLITVLFPPVPREEIYAGSGALIEMVSRAETR